MGSLTGEPVQIPGLPLGAGTGGHPPGDSGLGGTDSGTIHEKG
jgi:hypothetical protein